MTLDPELAPPVPGAGLRSFEITIEEFERIKKKAPSGRSATSRLFNRPDESDLYAIAEWNTRPVPTEKRKVATHLAMWFGSNCNLCHTPVDLELRHPHPGSFNVDHIVPKALGGTNTWGDVWLAHKGCNSQKNSISVPEPDAPLYAELLGASVDAFEHPETHVPSKIEALRKEATYIAMARGMEARFAEEERRNPALLERIGISMERWDARLAAAVELVIAEQERIYAAR